MPENQSRLEKDPRKNEFVVFRKRCAAGGIWGRFALFGTRVIATKRFTKEFTKGIRPY